MREQRWESQNCILFQDLSPILSKLENLGLPVADLSRESICYVEDFAIQDLADIDQLDNWPIEDLTLIHVLEEWQGDFFLLAGRFHALYQKYQSINTYCSLSHPWQLSGHYATLYPQAMLWTGFRHTHSFIRVRLHTTNVVTPGESWAHEQRLVWIDERIQAFQAAIEVLDLPIDVMQERDMVRLNTRRQETPFFCSWPDAFGPCQFEFNSSDPFEFLVSATQLASTIGTTPVTSRVYLTGFSAQILEEFGKIEPSARQVYRCSLHTPLNDLPHILSILSKGGRLYSSLCEFQTKQLLPDNPDASAIIGIMGNQEGFKLEVRFNVMPLEQSHMLSWLQDLLGVPVAYAPLSPFP